MYVDAYVSNGWGSCLYWEAGPWVVGCCYLWMRLRLGCCEDSSWKVREGTVHARTG